MTERVITSLAILKVNWDAGRDYVGNFLPFAAECLRTAPQAEISLPELQAAIRETFGLRIPQAPLKTILKRAAKEGYVTRAEGIYRRNEDSLATLNIAKVRTEMLRRYEALIRKLLDFCKTRYEINWSQEEAEGALLSYLQEHSTPILASALDGQPLQIATQSLRRAEFLINAFIAHLHGGDPEGFEFLEAIVKGSMLANATFFPDLGAVPRGFDRIEVYFDTTFLLRALGLAPPSMVAPCRELIDLLYEQNAVPRCFDDTFDEIRRVLDVTAHTLLDRTRLPYAYGETLEYLLNSGHQASDVELIIARLPQSLRALHVQVKPRPPPSVPLGVDEIKLRSILQEQVRSGGQAVGWVAWVGGTDKSTRPSFTRSAV